MGDIILKRVRKAIIIICTILLIPIILTSIPSGKYLDNAELKDKIKKGTAYDIEVNKSLKIDNAVLTIQRITFTNENTYLRYNYKHKKIGGNFYFQSIELYDDNGNKYISHGGESKGKLFGQDDLISYNFINSNSKEITLKLQLYDRNFEMKIPCSRSTSI